MPKIKGIVRRKDKGDGPELGTAIDPPNKTVRIEALNVEASPDELDPYSANFNMEKFAHVNVSKLLEIRGADCAARTLTWENLTMRGLERSQFVSDVPPPTTVKEVLMEFFTFRFVWGRFIKPKKISDEGSGKGVRDAVVTNLTGHMSPGEMILLLGPSGSGKSSVMRALAKVDTLGKANIDGTILVGGHPWDDPIVSSVYGRMSTYSHQSDAGVAPTLTVKETVEFAYQCRTRKETVDKFGSERPARVCLNWLGLSHVQNTIVGDAILRGVSGGQRRRVVFGEKCASLEVAFLFLDEITNGLDSTSALLIGKTLRMAAHLRESSVMVSLLQPSVELFEQFTKVLLLTPKGYQAYFGPRDQAVQYFENLGFKKPTTLPEAEFLQELTADPEKFADPARIPAGTNLDDAFFTENYFKSQIYTDTVQTIKDINAGKHYEFDEALSDGTAPLPDTPVPDFARSFGDQIKLVMGRQLKLAARNPASFARMAQTLMVSLVLGSLFFQLPNTAEQMTTKAGYLFASLLRMTVNGLAILPPDMLKQRAEFYRHREARFFQTRAFYFCLMILHGAFSFAEAFLQASITYWMVGLNPYNNSMFYGYTIFIYWGLQCSANALARCISFTSPSAVINNMCAMASLYLFLLLSGFAPAYQTIGWWWRWATWICPLAYAFEALILAEYYNRDVMLPDGTMAPGAPLAEQLLGQPRIPLQNNAAGLSSPFQVIWFNIGMIWILALTFDLLALLALHYSRQKYGPTTQRAQGSIHRTKLILADKLFWRAAKGTKAFAPPEEGTAYPFQQSAEDVESGRDGDLAKVRQAFNTPQITLTVKDLVYEVDLPPADKNKKKEEAPAPAATEEAANGTAAPITNGAAANSEPSSPSSIPASIVDADSRTVSRSSSMSMRSWKKLDEISETFEYESQEQRGQQYLGAATNYLSQLYGLETGSQTTRLEADIRRASLREQAPSEAAADELPPPAPGKLRLLAGATCFFEPGTMTALMGESGAGKTTLMDVIAGYKTGGEITGNIYVNGVEKDTSTWKSLAGYCEQSDMHLANGTVFESLIFSAFCRLPADIPANKKVNLVEEIIVLLGLEPYQYLQVGREELDEGLPKHARKRLTMAVELVANPSVLFLDEPTSGLDALAANVICAAMKRICQYGVTIVCTIHQPSRSIFESFDNLLLLKRGGKMVYLGPIGVDSQDVLSYFATIDPAEYTMTNPLLNPADWIMDICNGTVGGGVHDLPAAWKQSKLAAIARGKVEEASTAAVGVDKSSISKPSFTALTLICLRRMLGVYWRRPAYTAARVLWAMASGILVLTFWWNIPQTFQGPYMIIGAIFWLVFMSVVPALTSVVPIMEDRAVFYREVLSGTYTQWSHAIAISLNELPYTLVCSTLCFVIAYWGVGFTTTTQVTGYSWLMITLGWWFWLSYGQMVAIAAPNTDVANAIIGASLSFFTLTMGFIRRGPTIPPYWIWMYWISPPRYMLQGLASQQLHDQVYLPGPDGMSQFQVSFGVTQLTGDQVLESYGWGYSTSWWYAFVVVLLWVGGCEIAKLLMFRYVSWLKR